MNTRRSEAAIADMDNRRRQLRRWIDAHHEGVQARFAQAHRFNPSEISALLSNKAFGSLRARNLETHAGMPERYLERRDDDPVPNAAPTVVALHPEDDLPDDMVAIPEYSLSLSAGPGRPVVTYEIEEMREPATYRLSWLQSEGLKPQHLRRFKVTGESMIPLLYPNDVVLVNLEEGGDTPIKEGRVYTLLYDGDLRVKRLFFRHGDGKLTLRSENPDYEDETLTMEQAQEHIVILGRVRDKSGTGGL